MATIHLILPSGDINSYGDQSSYTVPLSNPIALEYNEEYECALVSAQFPHPGGGHSVFIQCSLCEYQRVGSSMVPLLFKSASVNNQTDNYRCVQDSIEVWVKISGKLFNQIDISLSYSQNLDIPEAALGQNNFTTIDLLIRKIR